MFHVKQSVDDWKRSPSVSRETSKQGALARHARVSGILLRGWVRLDQDLEGRAVAYSTPCLQTQSRKNLSIPAAWLTIVGRTAGDPNALAVTRSMVPESSGSLAISSTRPRISWPPVGASGHARTSPKSFIRFFIESTRIPGEFQRSNRTNPGKPPPLPRSRKTPGGAG